MKAKAKRTKMMDDEIKETRTTSRLSKLQAFARSVGLDVANNGSTYKIYFVGSDGRRDYFAVSGESMLYKTTRGILYAETWMQGYISATRNAAASN